MDIKFETFRKGKKYTNQIWCEYMYDDKQRLLYNSKLNFCLTERGIDDTGITLLKFLYYLINVPT